VTEKRLLWSLLAVVTALTCSGFYVIRGASKQGESEGRELGVCVAVCGSPYAEPLRLERYASAPALCVCPPDAARNVGEHWSLVRTDGGAP
jgi:hypothetical protein